MIAPPAVVVTDQNVNYPKYCVDTRKQLDIGNYACALLALFRYASKLANRLPCG